MGLLKEIIGSMHGGGGYFSSILFTIKLSYAV